MSRGLNGKRPLPALSLAVLWMLSDKPMHPYEIQQRFHRVRLDLVFKVSHGSLYRTVERLAERGLIDAVETEREGRRPERTVYAINERGRDELVGDLRQMIAVPAGDRPVLTCALSIASVLTPDDLLQQLRIRAIELEAWLAAHGVAYQRTMDGGLHRVALLELEYLMAHTTAELEFVRSLINDLERGELDWDSRQLRTPAPIAPAERLKEVK